MNVRVSVCMATYNGEKFISEQMNSILEQIGEQDEVIVVDDASTDCTYDLLLSIEDQRIKLFKNENNTGVNRTFERAILLAKGDYIFLSDQDDIWIEGRLTDMLSRLSSRSFVSSNFGFIDEYGNNLEFDEYKPLLEVDSNKFFLNIVGIFTGKRNYYGCAMAFDRSLVCLICPIPEYVESHDLWLAMAANLRGSVCHLEKKTLMRRIHGQNVSVISRPFWHKVRARFSFLRAISELKIRQILRN